MMKFCKTAAVLLAAVLCCASAALTGCSDSSSGSTNTETKSPASTGKRVYSPEVPDSIVDPSTPGQADTAKIGEAVNVQDKLTVTLDRVVEVDDVDKAERRVLLAEMTFTNNGDSKIDCSTLTHFAVNIDGSPAEDAIGDVKAAVLARRYYSAIQSDMNSINQAIEPGQTATGYVYIAMPSAWSSMQLVYTPFKYYTNDTVTFDIPESDLTHYSTPLPAAN